MLTKMIMFLALLWAPGVAMATPNPEPDQIETQCTNADQMIVGQVVDDAQAARSNESSAPGALSEQKPHHAHCIALTKAREVTPPTITPPTERLRGKPAAPEPTMVGAIDRVVSPARGVYWRTGPCERWAPGA